jgi:hypothetical protein
MIHRYSDYYPGGVPRSVRIRTRLLLPWRLLHHHLRQYWDLTIDRACWPTWRRERWERRMADPSREPADYRLYVRILHRIMRRTP